VLSSLKTPLNNPDEALTHRKVEGHFILVFSPCQGEGEVPSSPTTRAFEKSTAFNREGDRHFLPD